MAQKTNNMAFKMKKGSPMERNFSISPVKQQARPKKDIFKGIGRALSSVRDALTKRKSKEDMDIGKKLQTKYKGTKQTTDKSGNKVNTKKSEALLPNPPPNPKTPTIGPKNKTKSDNVNTNKKKVSYAAAYKNADKKKYPTLAKFTAAAKAYNDKKNKK